MPRLGTRLGELARRHTWTVDLATVGVLYLVTLFATATGSPPQPAALGAAAVLVAGVSYGALLLRRRRPLLVLAVTLAGAEVYLALCRGEMVLTAPLIALYAVADTDSGRRRPIAIAGLAVVALAGLHALQHRGATSGANGVGSACGRGHGKIAGVWLLARVALVVFRSTTGCADRRRAQPLPVRG
jgi:hypothetical protein